MSEPHSPAPDPTPLDDLRKEIDSIDDRVHDLLMRRAEVVERIGRAKGPDPVLIRPGREAQILRRLAGRHRGSLPLAVVLRIWREMIGGFTRMQGPFAVAVAGGADPGLRDLARDHFGSATSLIMASGPSAAIRTVMEGSATVAVVPWPQDREADPWWPALMAGEGRTPRIVARLPFAAAAPADFRVGLVLGRREAEPTGQDHSLLAIALAEDASRSRLKQAMDLAGLPAASFCSGPGQGGDDPAPQLVEVAAHVGPGDPRLDLLRDRLGGAASAVHRLGIFAVPIELGDGIPRPNGPASP